MFYVCSLIYIGLSEYKLEELSGYLDSIEHETKDKDFQVFAFQENYLYCCFVQLNSSFEEL